MGHSSEVAVTFMALPAALAFCTKEDTADLVPLTTDAAACCAFFWSIDVDADACLGLAVLELLGLL